jgi:hypothetical protein
MAKWIDDLDRPDSAAEQQKLREAAKVEEYWRQHPTARFTGEFFQALSKATRDQCEELDRRFPASSGRNCRYVRESDTSFQLANAAYSRTLAVDVQSRVSINVRLSPYVYDAAGHGYQTLKGEDLRTQWTPADVAALFIQWVLGLSALSALPWFHETLPPNWGGAFQPGG